MKFCPKCGNNINESQEFCSKCGYNLKVRENKLEEDSNSNIEEENQTAIVNTEGNYDINQYKTPIFKYKKNIIGIGVLCVALILFFIIGKSVSNPSKVVAKFENAITSDDKSKLVSVFYCSDGRLKIDEKSISPLMNYFKDNPSDLNKIMKNLNEEAVKLKRTKGRILTYGDSKDILRLECVGKKLLFFPEYKIVVKPSYVKINTSLKDVKFTLNGTEIGRSDSDDFSKEFGPFIPGKYKLMASYKGKYLSLNEPYDVDLISDNGKGEVDVLKDISYLQVTSDCPEAEIFVNSKPTGIKVMNSKKFGPVSTNTKIYGMVTKDGKKLKSNEYIVEDGDLDVYLSFQEVQDRIENGEKEIHDLIYGYTYSFAEAVNCGDFSIVEPYVYPASEIYNEQKTYVPSTYEKDIKETILSFEITSCKFNSDNTAGKVTTEEVYSIDNKDKNSVKTFKVSYTFKYNEATGSFQLSSITNL